MMYSNWKVVIAMVTALMVSACVSEEPATDPEAGAVFEWAVNVGGPAYTGVDGVVYAVEEHVSGGEKGRLENVQGTQDEPLYHTYRVGDIRVDKPLLNGVYDVILHFAEPEDIGGRERLFHVLVNGEKRVDSLDVKSARDGKSRSGLTVAVPNVKVAGGRLVIEFDAIRREPILSAVVVRGKPVASEQWTLVWQDEFDYEGAPDPAKWNIEEWPARKVNDEDQAYTSRPKNVRVENGNLVIEAHKENFDDASYTSGRIQSQGKGDFLYGRIEARAKLPRGMGSWPAIWMLPSDPFKYATTCSDEADWQGSHDCDAWPNSGEIDILEHVGYEMGHVHGTVHTKAYYWAVWEQRKGRILIDDVDEAYHDYVVEWSPERIDMYVDDSLYFTYMNEGTGWETWPFDHPFHVIINIAVGGMWGRAGGGIDDSIFPLQLLVDYVRVYESR
jgi:beta-glucanase (GH16 family)